jgi:uncharacterized protein YbaR (Trm112 family)
MPSRLPPCPACRNNLFVRVEQIISGRRVSRAYYCGRCNKEWRINDEPVVAKPERRTGERRGTARYRLAK